MFWDYIIFTYFKYIFLLFESDIKVFENKLVFSSDIFFIRIKVYTKFWRIKLRVFFFYLTELKSFM